MKKTFMAALAAVLLFTGLLAGEETVKVLPLEIPAAPAAAENTLLAALPRLQALGEELAAGLPAADIALLGAEGTQLVTLGSIKKGKLKWNHKAIQGKFLAVKFAAADYAGLAEIVMAKTTPTGYQIAACDAKTGAVISSFPVVFTDFADLAVQLNYPVKAAPGQSLRQEVSVSLENRGSLAARDIRLEIVLSSDDKVPLRIAPASATYVEDVLLESGSETIPELAAGQQVTVAFSGSLKLPEDAPPGKHYLAVTADPANRIAELSEDNNISSGYIMIDVPEPAAFELEMPETILHFQPADYGFKIVCLAAPLSDGKDWKLCKMKPNVYQIKHVSWSDFFWEIDTYEKAVWEITGVAFCKKGGRARDLGIRVEVAGGSLLTPPSQFSLKLARTRMRYEPAAKKFVLLAFEKQICHLPFWWVCKRESYLFQVRCVLWQDFFWQVDTFRKEAGKISGGKFCSAGDNAEKLPIQVTVEK